MSRENQGFGKYYAGVDETPRSPKNVPVAFILGACAIVVLAIAIVFSLSAFSVYQEAKEAKELATVVLEDFKAGNGEGLSSDSAKLTETVSGIYQTTHGIVWDAAAHLPLIGQDIANAQVLSEAGMQACEKILAPAANNLKGMSLSNLVVDKTFDINVLRQGLLTLDEVMPAVNEVAEMVSHTQPGTIGAINEPLEALRGSLSTVSETYGQIHPLLESLPSLLGENDQERIYVLLAQTNSELRAGGGLIGSVGLLRVRNGIIELDDFKSVYNYTGIIYGNGFSADLTQEEIDIFGSTFGWELHNATETPDYVRSGQIVSQTMGNALGQPVWGVIALDPVFLQRILGVIGEVTAEDGTVVNGQNAARELLSETYWRYGYEENHNALEDAFFSDVAKKSLDKLFDAMRSADMGTLKELWQTIVASGTDRRFQIWVADEPIEHAFSQLGLTGEIQRDVSSPEIGIYINDFSLSKICWYLDFSSVVKPSETGAPGAWKVEATLKNTFSEDAASGAPDYISNMNMGQPLRRGHSDMVESILIMAPLGSRIEQLTINEEPAFSEPQDIPLTSTTLYGRDTTCATANIFGGSQLQIAFEVTLPEGVSAEPTLKTSPLCSDI